ncbi:Hypothetical predicted protein [Mytilus galloprovincialis]|uniref:Uncharacterized protein n=1 Tax=Mytilus galloprovincialis TaxID=29158 RepID=A0A8B6DVC5_MYTGA|nr:Hypothetical predicted protein [Mytilus galloprovincialis]
MRDDVSVSSKTAKGDEDETQSSVQLRKRNLRPKIEPTEPPPVPTLPPVTYEKPPNPYETYLAIRRQVNIRVEKPSHPYETYLAIRRQVNIRVELPPNPYETYLAIRRQVNIRVELPPNPYETYLAIRRPVNIRVELPPNPYETYLAIRRQVNIRVEIPPNPYETYLAIRRQKITFQQKSLSVVQPKPPQGFKDYLLVNCSYVLQGNSASTLSVPMLSPPNSVTEKMRDLFIEQEKARYKLRLQHLTERKQIREVTALKLSSEEADIKFPAYGLNCLETNSRPHALEPS